MVAGLNSCAIFQGNNKPTELKLAYDESSFINYGYSFKLKSSLVYSNGKEKNITGKEELNIEISGAQYDNGNIYINAYPQKLTGNVIKVSAAYSKDEIQLNTSIEIPFNYKGDIELNFKGKQGSQGSRGEKGGTALLFRDGKDGGQGGMGSDGFPGDNLTIYVWKDSVDFYFLKVNNLISGETYIYKTKATGYAFRLNVNGGQGGQGGQGGDGGDGKDGSENNGKLKTPGNGGKGGAGGQGGNGGRGGNVYVFLHPNAQEFQKYISVYNFGGPGGRGGKGGEGGRGGTPLTGQTAGTAGTNGVNGQDGFQGLSGDVVSFIVEEFDIEY